MKIKVNDKEVLALADVRAKVIKNDIHEDAFQSDIERRVSYVVEHKYEQCFKRLKDQWDVKLKERYDSIPTDPDKLAELIFSQPDYKCRKTRDLEDKDKLGNVS